MAIMKKYLSLILLSITLIILSTVSITLLLVNYHNVYAWLLLCSGLCLNIALIITDLYYL